MRPASIIRIISSLLKTRGYVTILEVANTLGYSYSSFKDNVLPELRKTLPACIEFIDDSAMIWRCKSIEHSSNN